MTIAPLIEVGTANTSFSVHDLYCAEACICNDADASVLLRLETSDVANPDYWIRLCQGDFLKLAGYLTDLAHKMRRH